MKRSFVFKSSLMKKHLVLFTIILFFFSGNSQEKIEVIELSKMDSNQSYQFWLQIAEDSFGEPISIPVIVVKGKKSGPVLGLAAAIHGNELNGIGVIHRLLEELNSEDLSGTIIAIPGLNRFSVEQSQRLFVDKQDLNRLFPGKEKGNRSQQYVWNLNAKILSQLNYLVDLHTASFGRTNSLYVRGDFSNPMIKKMAAVQDADILLNSPGTPSAGASIGSNRTLRGEAAFQGIPAITIEYGNPQVFQKQLIDRGAIGLKNLLIELNMLEAKKTPVNKAVVCEKSYWIYTDQGGVLEVVVDLVENVKKGQLIAVLKDPFGMVSKKFFAPENGIIIGKSTNPINTTGGRILHLGVLEKK